MRKTAHIVSLYTLAHFLVDLACVYLVTSVVLGAPAGVPSRGWVIVLYNLLAFAGQLPLGIDPASVHLFDCGTGLRLGRSSR